jgi:hypothetical protein
MASDKIPESIIRAAAEVGSKTALDTYAKEKQKEKRARIDRRLRDTKRLMKSYREIKIHAGDAIASLSEVIAEDYDFFKSLMEEGDKIEVAAITRSKARSAIMLAHIDAMLQTYEAICYGSNRPEDARRYRVLEAMCLVDDPPPVSEIASQESIDVRTVYRDFDAACEKMSALLFGIQFIERE